jgi:hypothetical protein
VEPEPLIVAARFSPPDALRKYREWRSQNEQVLGALPADNVRVDIGRAGGGDFVRVWLPSAAAARCVEFKEHS